MTNKKLKLALGSFAADESGATAIEYAMIAAMVAIGLVTSLQDLGSALSASFSAAAALLNAV